MDTAISQSAATATHSQIRDETRGKRVFMMLSLILKRLNGGLHAEFTRRQTRPRPRLLKYP